ncbi:MAG: 2TM domain-containing protein [Acidimicrobiia bacterium]
MTVAHRSQTGRPQRVGGGPGWRFSEWLLGIFGGVGLSLGLLIFFAGDDQYVGIGGDLSWRVGDISATWAWGLLVGGGVLIISAGMMFMGGANRAGDVVVTGKRSSEFLWHFGIFVVVNALIWAQDLATGGGVHAYWVTVPWTIGLGAHAVAYYMGASRSG